MMLSTRILLILYILNVVLLCCNVLCFFAIAFFGMDITGALAVMFPILLCASALLALLSFTGEIAAIIKVERENNIPPFDIV